MPPVLHREGQYTCLSATGTTGENPGVAPFNVTLVQLEECTLGKGEVKGSIPLCGSISCCDLGSSPSRRSVIMPMAPIAQLEEHSTFCIVGRLD